MKRFLLCLLVLSAPLTGGAMSAYAVDFGNNLVNAADEGDADELMRLIKQGSSVNSKGEFNVTPLMRAAAQGHTKVMEILLNLGANTGVQDEGGATALHMACRQGQKKAAELLLHYDANVNAVDKEGWTPLMRASLAKNSQIIELLLNKGATVNQANQFGETALFHAAQSGDEKSVELLLGRGADTARASKGGVTPLAIAKRRGHGAVQALLAKAAPVAAPTAAVMATENQKKIAHAEADGWTKTLEAKAPVAPAPAPAPASTRYFLLQLGVAEQIALAKQLRDEIATKQQDILKDKKVEVMSAELGAQKQRVYRIRAGAYASEAEAKDACAALQQRDIQCFVVESSTISESMKTSSIANLAPAAAPSSAPAPAPARKYLDTLPWLKKTTELTPAKSQSREIAQLPPVLPKPAPGAAAMKKTISIAEAMAKPAPAEQNARIVIPDRMATMPKYSGPEYKGLYRYIDQEASQQPALGSAARAPVVKENVEQVDTFIPFASLFGEKDEKREEKSVQLSELAPSAAADTVPQRTASKTLENLWDKAQFWKEETSAPAIAPQPRTKPTALRIQKAEVEVEEAVRVPLNTKAPAVPAPPVQKAPPMAFYSSLTPSAGGNGGGWVELRGFTNEGEAWDYWGKLQRKGLTPPSAKVKSLGVVTMELGTFATGEEASSFCKEAGQGLITCSPLRREVSANPFGFLIPAAGATSAPTAPKDYWLFLGTYTDSGSAQRYYDRISKAYPAIFGKLGVQIMAPKRGGNDSAMFRVQAGPVVGKEEAEKTCETLRKHFVNCAPL